MISSLSLGAAVAGVMVVAVPMVCVAVESIFRVMGW